MVLPPWLRPPKGVHWTPRLGATLALIAIAAMLTLHGISNLLVALFTFGASMDTDKVLESALQKHEQLAKIDRERFDGRSAFYLPPEPVRNIPKPPPPKVEKPPPPPAPVIPTKYGGKKPIAVIGEIVYFGGLEIKVGEETEGIKVLATSAPWSVRLGYQGGEYDVSLWEKANESFFNKKWSASKALRIESSTTPAQTKDKNTAAVGATSGAPNTGATSSTTRANGSTAKGRVPISPLGSTPSNPQPGRLDDGPSVPAGTPLPSDSPPPTEPPQTAPPSDPNGVPPRDPLPPSYNPSASDNKGWESNQMAAPPPFTAEQIGNMPLTEAVATQATLQRAKSNPALDGATSERLANELSQIDQRINDLKKGQSPPS